MRAGIVAVVARARLIRPIALGVALLAGGWLVVSGPPGASVPASASRDPDPGPARHE
ncbi:hypothetical protein ACQP1P_16920 [Dactylosporangium sp. CA-052675]|uniref:hypothetical protein n=1 Tax=Dactylosporangium sp. CA-052675 TaxID=3239927 RepID=UPI003D910E6D